jgi:hypothetical protein
MDTKAQSAKAPGDSNHPDGTEAPRGTEEWIDDLAVLDAWTSSLVSVRGRSQATAKRYRRLVERLLKDVGKPIAQLDQRLIERHVRRLHVAGRGESVRRGVVVAIRSLGEWCLAHGIVDANPGASLSGPRPYRREIKVLTIAEVGRLLWGDSPGTLPQDPLATRRGEPRRPLSPLQGTQLLRHQSLGLQPRSDRPEAVRHLPLAGGLAGNLRRVSRRQSACPALPHRHRFPRRLARLIPRGDLNPPCHPEQRDPIRGSPNLSPKSPGILLPVARVDLKPERVQEPISYCSAGVRGAVTSEARLMPYSPVVVLGVGRVMHRNRLGAGRWRIYGVISLTIKTLRASSHHSMAD